MLSGDCANAKLMTRFVRGGFHQSIIRAAMVLRVLMSVTGDVSSVRRPDGGGVWVSSWSCYLIDAARGLGADVMTRESRW